MSKRLEVQVCPKRIRSINGS